MAIPKILLYYVFAPLADPEAVRLWQRDLCESLGLRGRILLSEHGMNGTVGGELPALKKYIRKTRDYAPFKGTGFKWSEGTATTVEPGPSGYRESLDFPKLSVKVRRELVTFGAPGDLAVDGAGVVGGGTHLTPQELHELVAARGEEVVFFDGRNAYEAAIGRFDGAIVPDVNTTADFVGELDSGKYDDLKGRPVVTYCTGGVRCEVLSSLMKQRGFEDVYQLDGGIARYGEVYGDGGLWSGSLYVFDGRGRMEFSPEAAVIGRCIRCEAPTSNVETYDLPAGGREQYVVCEACVGVPQTSPS
ncbi:MAG: rhodanese-related sulfurtransferase [Patulibacter sp.]|nr:rhodanese-related sulfurtransferase [Patulibacter sp.]